jgi:hypothetical protein
LDIFFSTEGKESGEEFSMKKLAPVASTKNEVTQLEWPEESVVVRPDSPTTLTRALLHVDSKMERGEWADVKSEIGELFKKYPQNKEVLMRRQKILDMENEDFFRGASWIEPVGLNASAAKRMRLEGWLEKIAARRKS